jgi:hypothetical protein
VNVAFLGEERIDDDFACGSQGGWISALLHRGTSQWEGRSTIYARGSNELAAVVADPDVGDACRVSPIRRELLSSV